MAVVQDLGHPWPVHVYGHVQDLGHYVKNLIHTFGRGGLDLLMGEMASRHADDVIVTDGHPRTEAADAIRKQVISGAPNAREIGNRPSAIEYGIKALREGDTLLIAGMGHENFQVIGEERIPYSDKATAQRIVEELSQPS